METWGITRYHTPIPPLTYFAPQPYSSKTQLALAHLQGTTTPLYSPLDLPSVKLPVPLSTSVRTCAHYLLN